jgi:hypothetical protein
MPVPFKLGNRFPSLASNLNRMILSHQMLLNWGEKKEIQQHTFLMSFVIKLCGFFFPLPLAVLVFELARQVF